MLGLCLIFFGTSRRFPKAAATFYLPSSTEDSNFPASAVFLRASDATTVFWPRPGRRKAERKREEKEEVNKHESQEITIYTLKNDWHQKLMIMKCDDTQDRILKQRKGYLS